jgi:hypothetical protein
MKDLVEFGRKLGVTLSKECIPLLFFLDLTLPLRRAIIYIKIINLIIISVQFGDAFFSFTQHYMFNFSRVSLLIWFLDRPITISNKNALQEV